MATGERGLRAPSKKRWGAMSYSNPPEIEVATQTVWLRRPKNNGNEFAGRDTSDR